MPPSELSCAELCAILTVVDNGDGLVVWLLMLLGELSVPGKMQKKSICRVAQGGEIFPEHILQAGAFLWTSELAVRQV